LIILRTTDTKKIVGFIAACPCNVIAHEELSASVIIDFVCVHKEHRKLRLCPLLYSIIYSKLHGRGIFTSLKTTGSDISFPVAEVQYHHLTLNEERLILAGFANRRQRVLPDLLSHPELSVLCPSDLPSAFELLNWRSECFLLAQQFLSPSHLGHVLLPRENIVFTLVKRTKRPNDIDSETFFSDYDSVETTFQESAADCEGGIETVTDLVSVFFVQTQILTEGNPLQGEYFTIAYLFYLSAVTMSPEELILAVAFEVYISVCIKAFFHV
jgi:glycylpeptide N-tetradecanoyltransferase